MTYRKPEVRILGKAADFIHGRPKSYPNIDSIVPGGPKLFMPTAAADLDE